MVQTLFGRSIEFSMRTFRFIAQGTETTEQQQTISCDLHLEPSADVPQDVQAADCTCYTDHDCRTQAGYTFSQESFGDVYYKKYDAMNFADAKAQCESDGTHIAIPRSGTFLRLFIYL